MDEMKPVHEWLNAQAPEMEEKLLALLSIASTQGEAAVGAPFGPGPAAALSFCLGLARSQGFTATDLDGYMGIIDLPGQEPEQVGILSHVDVVPAAAADWRYPPFTGTLAEGQIWGRGVLDDKGPLIACHYALLALRECHIPLRRSVRHLLGTNEETGMACIDYYKTHCATWPVCGFAPDAVFPVVAGEKGLLRWTCTARWDVAEAGDGRMVSAPTVAGAAQGDVAEAGGDLRLNWLSGGSGINCVPAAATAELTVTEAGWQRLLAAAQAQPAVSLQRQGPTVRVSAIGRAAHAAFPQQGDNALLTLVALLAPLELRPLGAARFLARVNDLLADWQGRGLGLAGADAYSSLTNLLSLMEVKPGEASFSCDTRYPVTWDGDALISRLEQVAAANDWTYSCWLRMDPLFYPEDDPLIASLLSVYRQQTGDSTPPAIIGSGTYGRKLPHFVAFGPLFPGDENITHQADERLPRENLLRLAHIYAEAICRLANQN